MSQLPRDLDSPVSNWPSPDDKEVDRRESYRYRTRPGREAATLSLGPYLYSAHLVDSSSGGFAVLVPEGPQTIRINDEGTLRTVDGVYAVRVVNIHLASKRRNALGGAVPMLRVGLRRVGDLVAADDPELRRATHGLRSNLRHAFPTQLAFVKTLIYTALVAGGVALVLMVVIAMIDPRSLLRDMRDAAGDEPDAAAAAAAGNERGDSPASPGTGTGNIRRAIQRLAGAEPFVVPEVIDALKLSPAQQARIRELHDTTASAIRDLDARASGVNRQEQAKCRALLMEAARREVLEVLTEYQRRKWRKLSE
jgi:hypothetical protein